MENKYCVYLHRRKSDNVPFYIGSGVESKRPFTRTGRSKVWNKFIENDDFIVEILCTNIDEIEARKLESVAIDKAEYKLVNIHKPIEKNSLSFDEVSKLVVYDVTSPTYLRWVISPARRCKVGEPAGSYSYKTARKKHVSSMSINGKLTNIHRVVWALHNNGLYGNDVIDHIDGNSLNNSIENLRKVSQALNTRNRLRDRKSNDLPSGVVKAEKSYYTSVGFNGKSYGTSFAIKKYGDTEALSKAIIWRSKKIKELNELQQAGFTSLHFEQKDGDSEHTEPDNYYGTPGVFPIRFVGKDKIKAVCAYVKLNGEQRVKVFSVNHYSEEVALRLAKDFKNKGIYTEEDFGSEIKVAMYQNGSLVNVFDSMTLAATTVGVDLSGLSKCCKGKQIKTISRTTGNTYTWKYHSS